MNLILVEILTPSIGNTNEYCTLPLVISLEILMCSIHSFNMLRIRLRYTITVEKSNLNNNKEFSKSFE